MAIPSRNRNGSFIDCEFMDVVACCKIHCCGHGTELVYPHQVIFHGYRRRMFRVEFPSNGTMLNVQRFRIISYYDIWFCRPYFRTAQWCLAEIDSVNIV